MNQYALLQYASAIAALVSGVVVAFVSLKKLYGRSVLRLMRSKTARGDVSVPLVTRKRIEGAVKVGIAPLPTNIPDAVTGLLRLASRARSRRTMAIVGSMLSVGLLQGLVFLLRQLNAGTRRNSRMRSPISITGFVDISDAPDVMV